MEGQTIAPGELDVLASGDNVSRSQSRRASVVAPLLGGRPQLTTKLFGGEETTLEEDFEEETEESGEEGQGPVGIDR